MAMRHLVTYDREAKANVAIALLEQNGIKAVPYGTEISAVEGPSMAFGGMQVMLVDEADYDRARAVLAANGDEVPLPEPASSPATPQAVPQPNQPHEQSEMLPDDRFRLVYLFSVVAIRVLGLGMLVFGLEQITFVCEYYGRLQVVVSSSHDYYVNLVNWSVIRTGMYSAVGVGLMYFSGPLSDLVTAGIRRK